MVFNVTINRNCEFINSSSQPSLECDRIALFFSGTIYNKGFLKRTLNLASNTTEEMLFEIFKTHTRLQDIIARINGIFSIVVVDKSTGMIMALRDRNGFSTLRYINILDDVYSFSDTTSTNGTDIEPGVIYGFSVLNDLIKTVRYNDYTEVGRYWREIRNKYIITKYKNQFKDIIAPISHLTTDQIIDFSKHIIHNTEYPAKIDMFKLILRVDMFKACEYAKLRILFTITIKTILTQIFQPNDVIYVLADDDISTIAIILTLSELGVKFKTFSVYDETTENPKIPYVVSLLKTEHESMPYNLVLVKNDIATTINTTDSIAIANTLPVYMLCRYAGSSMETNINLILPTLSNELFGGSFDSSVADEFARDITINRLIEAHRFTILETIKCVEKYNVRAHYPYNDIHLTKYALFLNNKPRDINGKLQTRSNLKMAFSNVEDEKLLDLIFSDTDTITPIVRGLENI